MTRADIRRTVAAEHLVRVRKGRYVGDDVHPDLVRAAELGGRLDCVSLLTHLGVFIQETSPLHLQADPDASRLPSRPSELRCHWRTSASATEALVVDVVEALVQAVKCQTPRASVATLDSAWHLGWIDEADVAEVFRRLPRRYHALRPLLDPRGEAGTETIVRLILRTIACEVQLQVVIDGVGRVDLLVDGWLIIECDSKQFHEGWDAQRRDRRRDLAAAQRGYTTIRLLAEDVLWHPDTLRAALVEVIAQRPS